MEARQAQVRFDPVRIQLNGVVEFFKGLVFLLLREEHAAHQNVAFDVVRIFLKNFLREFF